jgi:NADH-quinone oxidoreductase subunit L
VSAEALLPFVLLPTALGALLLGLLSLWAARRGAPGPAGLAGPIATAGSVGSFVLALLVVCNTPAEGVTASLGTWIEAGAFKVDFALRADPLSSLMLMVVTGVGSLIHVYATGYMKAEHGRLRFFCYLNLFLTAMLVLVLGENLLLLFAGWEGVGLCSYLLIGYWYDGAKNAAAGQKAFLINRVGDAGVLVGLCLLAWSGWALSGGSAGGGATLSVTALRDLFTGLSPDAAAEATGTLTLGGLLLLLGVCGKSAQVPLSVWLPDAMAGPTPVSALIHAATMVTAGIYLLTRLDFLYAAAPTAAAVVLVVGATTAVVAGVSALGQRELKRVLAYSTVSQLGFMVAAAGALAPYAAMFHVVTHAFFKAALFLGAGIVIHAMHGEADLLTINGRAKPLKSTALAMGIACLALAGVPPLAGFWSKEGVLAAVWTATHVSPLLKWGAFACLAIAAVATAAYSTRLWVLCFKPEPGTEPQADDLHLPDALQVSPVLLLAVLAIVGGALSLPFALPPLGKEWLHHFLGGAGAHAPHPEGAGSWILLAVSIGAVVAGGAFGWTTARRAPSTLLGTPGLDRAVGHMGQGMVELTDGVLDPAVERGLLGGAVEMIKILVYGGGTVGSRLQNGRVRFYALLMAAAAAAIIATVVWP